jgi:phosphate transport system permease protein
MSERTRRLPGSARQRKLARLFDRLATTGITVGGVLIIICVVGILVFVVAEALPLFGGADAEPLGTVPPPDGPPSLAIDSDDYVEILAQLTASGEILLRNADDGSLRERRPMPDAPEGEITALYLGERGVAAWGGDGRAGLFLLRFHTRHLGPGERETRVITRSRGVFDLGRPGAEVLAVQGAVGEEGEVVVAAVLGDGSAAAVVMPEDEDPILTRLAEAIAGRASAIAVSQDARLIALGTDAGELLLWEQQDGSEPEFLERVSATASAGAPVTTMAFLLGARSVVVGSGDGDVAVWFQAQDPAGGPPSLARVHEFPQLEGAVLAVSPSRRDRGFVAADAAGNVVLRHATSRRTLERIVSERPLRSIRFAPRSDNVLLLAEGGEVARWGVENPHPEVSARTLFGKVWYEGMPEPQFVWQSTGLTDEFEPKLSVIPLVFGTVKGTLYALIFSIPIALLGALYTAQFAHPSVRHTIKPVVEILAALPSVVIGAVAALWLAPFLERNLLGFLAALIALPVVVVLGSMLWETLPRRVRTVKQGAELLLVAPFGAAALILALAAGPWIERVLFGSDFRFWLLDTMNLAYDPRNSVVVGFALGFAVIPVIFTIAEDALSSVPRHLVSASLALGASRWQTAWRVVVPTASAGIFSAVMLGFGRAVGETMIVLMATGNTPILDWGPFNGFRTLSANIAVELPEAPADGTLYRVLFLSAALLFVITFTANTLAELVSFRLRRKYQRL